MPATNFTIEIEQGIPYNQDFIIKNLDGSNKDLTGFTARMQFREFVSSPAVSLNATTENGKLFIDSENSTLSILLTEDDTKFLSKNTYVYDLEIVNSANVPARLIKGSVKNSLEVTR